MTETNPTPRRDTSSPYPSVIIGLLAAATLVYAWIEVVGRVEVPALAGTRMHYWGLLAIALAVVHMTRRLSSSTVGGWPQRPLIAVGGALIAVPLLAMPLTNVILAGGVALLIGRQESFRPLVWSGVLLGVVGGVQSFSGLTNLLARTVGQQPTGGPATLWFGLGLALVAILSLTAGTHGQERPTAAA